MIELLIIIFIIIGLLGMRLPSSTHVRGSLTLDDIPEVKEDLERQIRSGTL